MLHSRKSITPIYTPYYHNSHCRHTKVPSVFYGQYPTYLYESLVAYESIIPKKLLFDDVQACVCEEGA